MSVGVETAVSLPATQPLSFDKKSPTAFRTISEVADDLALPQHVLRFWESKFPQIKPLKRGGGRRYYRPEDVKVIYDIKGLLYDQGFTIRGVQKLLRESTASSIARSKVAQPQLPIGMQAVVAQGAQAPGSQLNVARHGASLSADARREMEGVLAELKAIRKILHQSGI